MLMITSPYLSTASAPTYSLPVPHIGLHVYGSVGHTISMEPLETLKMRTSVVYRVGLPPALSFPPPSRSSLCHPHSVEHTPGWLQNSLAQIHQACPPSLPCRGFCEVPRAPRSDDHAIQCRALTSSSPLGHGELSWLIANYCGSIHKDPAISVSPNQLPSVP